MKYSFFQILFINFFLLSNSFAQSDLDFLEIIDENDGSYLLTVLEIDNDNMTCFRSDKVFSLFSTKGLNLFSQPKHIFLNKYNFKTKESEDYEIKNYDKFIIDKNLFPLYLAENANDEIVFFFYKKENANKILYKSHYNRRENSISEPLQISIFNYQHKISSWGEFFHWLSSPDGKTHCILEVQPSNYSKIYMNEISTIKAIHFDENFNKISVTEDNMPFEIKKIGVLGQKEAYYRAHPLANFSMGNSGEIYINSPIDDQFRFYNFPINGKLNYVDFEKNKHDKPIPKQNHKYGDGIEYWLHQEKSKKSENIIFRFSKSNNQSKIHKESVPLSKELKKVLFNNEVKIILNQVLKTDNDRTLLCFVTSEFKFGTTFRELVIVEFVNNQLELVFKKDINLKIDFTVFIEREYYQDMDIVELENDIVFYYNSEPRTKALIKSDLNFDLDATIMDKYTSELKDYTNIKDHSRKGHRKARISSIYKESKGNNQILYFGGASFDLRNSYLFVICNSSQKIYKM